MVCKFNQTFRLQEPHFSSAWGQGGLQVVYLVVLLRFRGTDVKSCPPPLPLPLPAGILMTVGGAKGFVGQQRRPPAGQQPDHHWRSSQATPPLLHSIRAAAASDRVLESGGGGTEPQQKSMSTALELQNQNQTSKDKRSNVRTSAEERTQWSCRN